MPENTSSTPNQPGRWVVSKFGPPSVLRWDVFDPLPTPSNGELLIRIIVGGIGQIDTVQRVGAYPDPRFSKPGFTSGYDFTGKVEELGPDVTGFDVGDVVASMCISGAYATHIVLPFADATKLRADDDIIKAATLPLNYMTAYDMLKRSEAKIEPGSSILIGPASGGIGTAMAQLVKAFDLDITMYGLCSPTKFDHVKALGVTPIDRHTPNVAALVRKLNGGKGADVSFDAAGSKESLDSSLEATEGSAGQVIAIGGMSLIAPDGSGMVDPGSSICTPTLPNTRIWPSSASRITTIKHSGTCSTANLTPSSEKSATAVAVHEALLSGVGVVGKMAFLVDAELAVAHGL